MKELDNYIRCGNELDDEIILCNSCCDEAISVLAEQEKHMEWVIEYEELQDET